MTHDTPDRFLVLDCLVLIGQGMLDLKGYPGVPLMHRGYRRVDADLLLVDCVRGLAGGGKALDREKPSVGVVRCSLILKVEFCWLPNEDPL